MTATPSQAPQAAPTDEFTPSRPFGLPLPLSPTEAALIDFQKGREALARRQKQLGDPAVPGLPGDRADTLFTQDMVDALTRPVRIEISFDDPIKTREQLNVLAAAIVEAQQVTFQHHLGINRQRLNLRHTMKSVADVLVLMNGKTPSGKRRPGSK